MAVKATDVATKEWASHALANLCRKAVRLASLIHTRGDP